MKPALTTILSASILATSVAAIQRHVGVAVTYGGPVADSDGFSVRLPAWAGQTGPKLRSTEVSAARGIRLSMILGHEKSAAKWRILRQVLDEKLVDPSAEVFTAGSKLFVIGPVKRSPFAGKLADVLVLERKAKWIFSLSVSAKDNRTINVLKADCLDIARSAAPTQ